MNEQMIVGRSFSIFLRQVGQLAGLGDDTGRKDSDLIREAIDDLLIKYEIVKVEDLPHPKGAKPVPLLTVIETDRESA